jgi:hypothetical protein
LSRRRDRERFEAMKRLDPDYRGFRGHENEPSRRGNTPLEPVVCVSCGRKRNVPRGVALERRENYVCSRCADSGEVDEGVESEQTS